MGSVAPWHVGSYFPNRDWNSSPALEGWFLTTGPPGSPCPVFNWVCLFVCLFGASLLLNCMSSLYTLDISSLVDTWFANVFSCLAGYLFTLLLVSFLWFFHEFIFTLSTKNVNYFLIRSSISHTSSISFILFFWRHPFWIAPSSCAMIVKCGMVVFLIAFGALIPSGLVSGTGHCF